MNTPQTVPRLREPHTALPPVGLAALAPSAQKVLRNTWALLGLTLLFSAAVAAASAAFALPHPGLMVALVGTFGLFHVVARTAHSGWGLVAVFGLTGFMGYTLGPAIAQTLAMPGGAQVVAMALGATAATFLALSASAIASGRDFSGLGGFLMVGMVVALLAAIGAIFFQVPALALAVAAMVAALSAGLILYETSRIVNGGESNYVLATVGLYLSIYNLFASLLQLLGFANTDE